MVNITGPITFFFCIVAFKADDAMMSSLLQLVKNLRCSGAIYLCQPRCSDYILELLDLNTSIVVIRSSENLGYGRAVNLLAKLAPPSTSYLIISNPDICIDNADVGRIPIVLHEYNYPVLLSPRILNMNNSLCFLCKQNPTLIALVIRYLHLYRYLSWARYYDCYYTMRDHDYGQPFECTYLSGCFMIVRRDAFNDAGGFDERYFLYLEDADLTRTLSAVGRTVYTPCLTVKHGWGRGPYKSVYLALVNIHSYYLYVTKWGFRLF